MAYHPRIEASDKANFLTTKTVQSRLWFVNNPQLEEKILGYAAKFADRYQVALYALAIEGSHIQKAALFPNGNRAGFMRDFNSCVARAIPQTTAEHGGGRVWGRRYSNEFLPDNEDLEEYFFYTVLQPINDGLVERISDYPGYNCFHDAVWGVKKKFQVVRWYEFNAAKRRDAEAKIGDYTDVVYLEYKRVPGYEELTQSAYAHLMMEKLEEKRLKIVEQRRAAGKGFAGRAALLKTARGAVPRTAKTSNLTSRRARVLCVCSKRGFEAREWYFYIYFEYRRASKEYRAGKLDVKFPKGTYPPHMPCNGTTSLSH